MSAGRPAAAQRRFTIARAARSERGFPERRPPCRGADCQSGQGDVGVEVRGGHVVRWHPVKFSALLVQGEGRGGRARAPVVPGLHLDDRADAGEGEKHHGDQRLVARADDGRPVDGIKEGTGLLALEDRRLAGGLAIAGPAHRRGEGRKSKADPVGKRNPGIPGSSACHKPFGS
jgi:hypothetical protein